MVKQIVRDVFFLGQPSEPATKADIQVGKDLQDTLQANRERCVGMAANMIGVKKNIIIQFQKSNSSGSSPASSKTSLLSSGSINSNSS